MIYKINNKDVHRVVNKVNLNRILILHYRYVNYHRNIYDNYIAIK